MKNATTKPDYRHLGKSKAYFYDLDTGEELYHGTDMGHGPGGVHKGIRYMDTTTEVTVSRDGFYTILTAADFANRRVVVKFWYPGAKDEWLALVDLAKGWEETYREYPTSNIDIAKRMRNMPRKAA